MVLEKTLESPLDCKEINPVNPKGNQSWIFIGRTDAQAETPKLRTWCEELTHWKRPWCWERLKAGEGNDRERDDWMASPTQWTWIWTSSGKWWGTGKPGMLQSMGSQRDGNNWATEQQQISPERELYNSKDKQGPSLHPQKLTQLVGHRYFLNIYHLVDWLNRWMNIWTDGGQC